MGQLKILKKKDPVGKEPRFVIALNGRPLSGHRTLKGARARFKKFLKIAKTK